MISIYQISKKNITLQKFLLISTLLLIIFIPQLYNNVVYYGDFSPLIHTNLYAAQSHDAVNLLKYATVIIPGEKSDLRYFSNLPITKTDFSFFDLLVTDPLSFFMFILFIFLEYWIGVMSIHILTIFTP